LAVSSSAVVEHLPTPNRGPNARNGRASDDQALVAKVAKQLLAGECPEGVPQRVLIAAIQSECPDKDRPDTIKRTIRRAVEAGLLTIDRDERIHVPLR
jgi:hypothetical protein